MIADETTTTVVGVFKHLAQAQRAVDALLDAGFDRDGIVLGPPHGDFEHTEESEAVPYTIAAAAIGGLAALLAGRTIGGRRHRTGPGLLWALAGTALGAAAGWLALRASDPHTNSVHYDEGNLRRGRAVVTVEAGDRRIEAEVILRSFGARGLKRRSEPHEWQRGRRGVPAAERNPPEATDDRGTTQPAGEPDTNIPETERRIDEFEILTHR